jgi:hypothetical protein
LCSSGSGANAVHKRLSGLESKRESQCSTFKIVGEATTSASLACGHVRDKTVVSPLAQHATYYNIHEGVTKQGLSKQH